MLYAVSVKYLALLETPQETASDPPDPPTIQPSFAEKVLKTELMAGAEFQTEPPVAMKWPDVHMWDFAFGVDWVMQGDGRNTLRTEWHSCLSPGRKPTQCSESHEYRKDHHIKAKDWKG
jgi:hypothetical protein